VKKLFLLLFLSFIVFSFINCMDSDKAEGINKNLFRLHVIANSDSPADQTVKLKVRNTVIDYLKEKEKNITDIEEFKKVLIKNKEELTKVVNNTLKQYGMDYTAVLKIGVYDFPEKIYYGVTVDEGKYEALRIILGKGEGKNWWCVLFPPLCFVDLEYEDQEGAEMAIEDIEDVEVRSKLLEWLKKIKNNQ